VSEVGAAIEALRAGRLAVIPTDTVYGLAADGASEPAARALYAAKGRNSSQPTAVLFASVERLLHDLPELPHDAVAVVRELLPGALTFVLPNPGRRFVWLNETRPDAVGVRVPAVSGPGKEILDAVGARVAKSAKHPGGPDTPGREDVPGERRAAASAAVDGGELAGAPSTVVDLTGEAPLVLREGAVPTAEALARIRGARLRAE
jgi:tRNA threonylcarbamoyl adenosine modification protein (Sua5/YciO/YrdC/YwlC family)